MLIILSSFPRVFIEDTSIITDINFYSSIYSNLFRSMNFKVKNLWIKDYYSKPEVVYNELDGMNLYTIFTEYGVSLSTYCFYKFLINTKLVESVEEVMFIGLYDIDMNLLSNLISNYTINCK